MKKLFISQPMRGKTDAEILAERSNAIQAAKDSVKDEIEVIDSFFQDAPVDATPLWYLGENCWPPLMWPILLPAGTRQEAARLKICARKSMAFT